MGTTSNARIGRKNIENKYNFSKFNYKGELLVFYIEGKIIWIIVNFLN